MEIEPNWPEAQYHLGKALYNLGQIDVALELFRQSAALGNPELLPRASIAVVIPGSPQADNQAVLDARLEWARQQLPAARPAERFAGRPLSEDQLLRIGYLSSFFQDDNWMKPVWALINQHDRRRFQIHLFSDSSAAAIEHGYCKDPGDGFHDISSLANEAAADEIERAEIDLLVDLNGFSETRRLPLLALRPAPLVVGWFNSFATSGMSCYDYLIGDEEAVPPEEERYYCERIVRVPGSYLTFEVAYPVPEVASPPCCRQEVFTFGSLASQYKINDDVIAAWARILQQAPGARLILKNAALHSPENRDFVCARLEEQGIARERIVLEGPADHYRFLQKYDEIDVALDTFPYNGGTTTSEAIWQGVPVVTFRGDRWASRTSASILRAGNLGEFVAQDLEGYVAMAVRLATSADARPRLSELRREMRSRLRASPLCDSRGFARNMEHLYAQMWREWRRRQES